MRTIDEIENDIRQANRVSDADALLQYAEELDTIGTMPAIAKAHHARGIAQYCRGDITAALEHYHRALATYEELGDRIGVANAIGGIGNLHIGTGDQPEALEYYHRALAIHEKLDNRNAVAGTMNGIGQVHHSTGDFPAALEHLHRALAVFEELGDRGGLAMVMSNIGIVHHSTGDLAAGLEYLRRALTLHEELGDRSGVARVTGNIGLLLSKTGDFSGALELFRNALVLHEELGERNNVVRVSGNMLRTYIDMGSDNEAQAQLEVIDAMHVDGPGVRIIREQDRATLQERSGDLDAATATLHRALVEAQEHGMRPMIAATHKALRELALKKNDLAGYVEHNNEYTRITDEINGKDTATKLAMQDAERRIATERQEHQKHLAVLHSTLPKHIADRVARGEQVNDHYDKAAVLFLDIVGFTSNTSNMPPPDVVKMLEHIFSTIDGICDERSVTKIKTIGDSYMCFRGDADATSNAMSIASVALDAMKEVFTWPNGELLQFRAGIHIGPATAGVIGTQRLQYDVWGDTVNVASRMESTGEPGRIHVSEAFANALISSPPAPLSSLRRGTSSPFPIPYSLRERGTLEIKGKGMMSTYWLENNIQ